MTYQYNAHKGGAETDARPQTAASLIAFLKKFPPHTPVVMSVDGKSWHVTPVQSAGNSYLESSDDRLYGWLNNAADRSTVPCICLWPQATTDEID